VNDIEVHCPLSLYAWAVVRTYTDRRPSTVYVRDALAFHSTMACLRPSSGLWRCWL
jgi:hypothetical protein